MLTIEQCLTLLLEKQDVLLRQVQENIIELKSRMVELEVKLKVEEENFR